VTESFDATSMGLVPPDPDGTKPISSSLIRDHHKAGHRITSWAAAEPPTRQDAAEHKHRSQTDLPGRQPPNVASNRNGGMALRCVTKRI
jgi:hypothetical protein